MNHKRYTHYKPSNVDWLGDIPAHWEVRKLKYLTEFNPSKTLFLKTANLSKEVVFLPMEKVSEDGKIDNSIKKPIHEVANGYTFFEQGDVIYAKITPCFENGKGAYLNELETNQGFGSTEFTVLRPNLKFLNGAYLQYILQSKFFRKIGERFMEGAAGQKRVSTDFVKNFTIGIPSLTEQTAIVTYLNRKLADIDTFIAKKQRLITLLQEQKAAMINKAVTKGLNENENADCNFRASGVDWIGDIPIHWEVKKLKYIAKTVLGKMLCNTPIDGFYKKPYLKSKNIQWLRVDTADVEEMYFSEKELTQFKLHKGDLILSEGGEVGKTCIWNNELAECYIQNSAHKVTFNAAHNSRYFLYQFFYAGKIGLFDSIVNRVSIAHLTQEKLRAIKFIVPPLAEQIAIVSHIEAESARIDKAIQLIERELTLVQEYRTALIAEAVTGKIDCTP